MKSNQEYNTASISGSTVGSPTASSSLPRLGPTWRSSGPQGSRKGFQPPPPADSLSSSVPRSGYGTVSDSDVKSTDQQQSSSRNSFSALMMDMDDDDNNASTVNPTDDVTPGGQPSRPGGPGNTGTAFSSRSEALRSAPPTGYNRSASAGERSGSMTMRGSGRSLRELASMMNPTAAPTARVARASSSTAVTSNLEETTRPVSSLISSFEPDKKVIRYTREKLLSMRPRPSADKDISHLLKDGEGTFWFSKEPLDPVCWDTFDPDEIWVETVKRGPGLVKNTSDRVTRRDNMEDDVPRRGNTVSSSFGRWERGVALPPPEERARNGGSNKNEDSENPDELWDDPLSSARLTAAADFSAFGGSLDDEPRNTQLTDNPYDLTSFAEAALKFEGTLHRENKDKMDSKHSTLNGHDYSTHTIDPTRPLASIGTTIRSGCGDDVNVFEDFDDPVELVDDALTGIKAGEETESLSSRLMQMIGVNNQEGTSEEPNLHVLDAKEDVEATSIGLGTSTATTFTAMSLSLSKNPWGTSTNRNVSTDDSMDLAARLQQLEVEKKRKEEIEAARLRKEEEEKRLAALQAAQQAEAKARQQAAVSAQQTQGHSQVELILIERVGTILEKSWGRSDIVSILSTLHAEDSRVIPLLSSADALRALLLRHPRRIALMKDPSFGTEIAVLLMTNTQFQQQQTAQEMQRRQMEQQQQLQVAARANAEAEARAREVVSKPVLITDAPWYYADPQGNIQGPFGGEEMRQWLEAGYFKGDLPISQSLNGNFRPLASIFPDLSIAFRISESSNDDIVRIRASEEEAMLKEEAALRAEKERLSQENSRIQAEKEERARIEEAAKAEPRARHALQTSVTSQMQSEKLKMMLGLGGMAPSSSDPLQPSKPIDEQGRSSVSRTVEPQIVSNRAEPPKGHSVDTSVSEPKLAQTPAVPAWGGAGMGNAGQKLSVSEIQMEEARAAALLAQQREKVSRSSSGGWANVAASGGTTAWAGSVNVKPAPAVLPIISAHSTSSSHSTGIKDPSSGTATQKQSSVQQTKSPAQNTVDDFGANGKMTPTLEAWCKDQMRKLSGNDDLTLIAFCMTLTDPTEIRQYLTAYLGSTPQVTSFATEFINRKNGSAPKQEMWESTVNNKKGRKKKASS